MVDRVQPGLLERRRQAGGRQAVAEPAIRPIDARVGARAAVVDHAGVDAEAAGHQRGARGQARRIRAVGVVEPHALRRDAVDVGRGVPVIPVAAEVVGPQGVEVEVENAHGLGLHLTG